MTKKLKITAAVIMIISVLLSFYTPALSLSQEEADIIITEITTTEPTTTEPTTTEPTTTEPTTAEPTTTEPTTTEPTATEPTTTEPTTTEPTATEPTTTEPTTTEPTTTEPEPSEPDIVEPEEEKDSDIVGEIYLCSRWSSIFTTGHLWVYIKNTSDKAYKIGLYDLQPGEGLSLATFGFSRSDGFGLYYNMEAYQNEKYCEDSCVAIGDTMTRAEMREVSKELLTQNRWNIFRNCVYFACDIWNIAGNKRIVPFFYPPITRWQIMASDNSTRCYMEHQPGDKVFKQYDNGEDAYLRAVSQKSLDA